MRAAGCRYRLTKDRTMAVTRRIMPTRLFVNHHSLLPEKACRYPEDRNGLSEAVPHRRGSRATRAVPHRHSRIQGENGKKLNRLDRLQAHGRLDMGDSLGGQAQPLSQLLHILPLGLGIDLDG